jgi:hypothetical protein
MEYKDTDYFNELFTDEEIYAEMFPTFDQVNKEVIQNPNKRRTHIVMDSMCIKHHFNLRAYKGIDSTGRAYTTTICPLCVAENKKARWKQKIKVSQNFE